MDYHRQMTPPSAFELDGYHDFSCPGGSASTSASYFPNDWSPESIITTGTAATTPPKSPPKIREIGPTLLPRVRTQDQMIDSNSAFRGYHIRTASLPVDKMQLQVGGYLPRPSVERRSTSPPITAGLPTPGSAPLSYEYMKLDPASCRPSTGSIRSRSSQHVRTHSRNSSLTSIDANVLGRYGFPTYRQSPTPQPMSASSVSMARTASAMSHLAPISMPGGQMQSYPLRRRTASPPANSSRLSTELELDSQYDFDYPDTSILDYLTAPNPTPSLTMRTVEGNRSQNSYYWYDIRNVLPWSDFNIDTISAIPGLLNILQVRVPSRNLPSPGKVNLNPETPSQLADMCAHHHAVKVNAALKLAQGDKHMAMRTLKSPPGIKPEFVSNYQSEIEKTIYGDGRGRVIGIVKCYDQWNSGMRSGSPTDKVKYLQSLAHLQRFMREHESRYGFIMTEIELVCVRAGGEPDGKSNVPLFGYFEVAEPIRVAVHGLDGRNKLQMTAGLALWYLHMLAKEQPLPGQYHWKIDVGPPGNLTRQHHLPRDTWMPKPNLSETREAKRIRGWIWPNEALSKRECGRGRKVKM